MPDYWRHDVAVIIARQAMLDGLEAEAGRVLKYANEIVPLNKRDPVHRGTLQRSGELEKNAEGVTIRYSVKGEPVDYALLQHEHPEGTPPHGYWSHMPGRHWKYLETPFARLIGDTRSSQPITRAFRWEIQRWVREGLRRSL